MKFRYTFIIVLLLLFQLLSARGDKLYFNHLTTSNGLSNNFVHYIYQDHKGFIWFGTDDGLNLFDGYDIKVFKNSTKDPNSLSSNSVFEILEDSKGQIWIAASNGVDIYDRQSLSFNHIPFFDSVAGISYESYTRAIIEDTDGNILIANSSGVYIYNTERHAFIRFLSGITSYNNSLNEGIRTMLIDRNNRIWIGSLTQGLFGYDLKRQQVVAASTENSGIRITDKIFTLAEDSDGNIWVGTERGLYSINANLSIVEHKYLDASGRYPNSNNILKIYIEDKSHIWLGTDGGGLILFDTKNNTLIPYIVNEFDKRSINNNSVRAICRDKQGILWLGTLQGGINYAQLEPLKNFTHIKSEKGQENSLCYDAVSVFYEDSHERIWIGTDGGGLDLYDPKTALFKHYTYNPESKNSINGNSILAITGDRTGDIWIGGYLSGINIIDPLTGQIRGFKNIPGRENSLSNDDVRDILFDKNDNVWIATNGGGLNIFDQQQRTFRHYHEGNTNAIASNWCIKLFMDSRGLIWIGTYGGLSICDPKTMTFTNYFKSNTPGGLSNNWVYSFAEDKKGNVWIGTANGLNYFNWDSKKITKILSTDGLPNEVINGILIDKNEYLWLSTNKGIIRYNLFDSTFKVYNTDDGVQGLQFIHGAYMKSHSGEMFFGGLNGFNTFYPENIRDNTYIPDVYLRDLLIFFKEADVNIAGSPLKKSIETAGEVDFNSKQTLFTFKYAALNYISPAKNQYAYMLEGFDKEWNNVGTRREATYTNLNPGKYTFRVRASNDDGIWNLKGASIKVVVLPPWYKTWVFRISLVLFIIFLIVAFYLYRVSSLKQQKIQLEKLVRKRTSEIEEKNKELSKQATELSEINTLLEERQQQIEQQAEVMSEANTLLEERQQQIEEQTEELLTQRDELEKVNIHLQELNTTKDKFFSIIAHDLKNPFGTILGFVELMYMNFDKMTDEKKKDFIKIIYTASQNVFNLLENLLLWARSQTNRIKFEPVVFNVTEQINENITLLKEMYQRKNISLAFNQSEPAQVFADKNMINTIIRNVISNAVKFTPNGGEISVTLSNSEDFTTISVKDSGIGISIGDIDKLFRVDAHSSREGTAGETGTGLGLILCKEYIDKHKTRIWVESTEGKGSTFFFTIPAAKK
jgi:signal transduction histidine kinase/ligand-binding sensor domain-containing protein